MREWMKIIPDKLKEHQVSSWQAEYLIYALNTNSKNKKCTEKAESPINTSIEEGFTSKIAVFCLCLTGAY